MLSVSSRPFPSREPESTLAAPRHVVRLIQAVSLQGAGEHLGSAAHEVVKEVVAQLDEVHDGLGALEDLPVEGRLDVRLSNSRTLGSNFPSQLHGAPPPL